MQAQKDKQLFVSAIILVIVHVAGIIGIHSVYRDFFLALTPVNLLLSAFLLLLNHKNFNKPFLLFIIVCSVSGFFIEFLGVKTKIIFGYYDYRNTLGWKLLDVPLVIGVNWLMLVYCAGIISDKIKTTIILKSCIGALMLVILDNMIEPVSGKYGFWEWYEGIAPMRNYIAWFIVSFLLLYLFHSLKFNKQNKLAPVLLIIQFLFFAVLCFF
ncbi:MAG: carotenoid biosynthesis protein [Bacteroidetes bacterium]|nr:carotenoid biosynthesis protein [Bacteroidota bacterium]